MKTINKVYINGKFVTPHGNERFDLINPTDNSLIAQVILADEIDARNAIEIAKKAFETFSKTTIAERKEYLQKLYEAAAKKEDELINIMVKEYGGTLQFCRMSTQNAINSFQRAIETLDQFNFERKVNESKVVFGPLGVVGIITPWNSSNSFIASKLSMAIAAGCTTVIKPSEMSALQTELFAQCVHEAKLPDGIVNIVTGLDQIVGNELTLNRDISKISFTGSTAVGKAIAKGAADTMKRVTLELGGKSPNILLDDADFEKAIPMAITAAFQNSGQACVVGSRLLVPEDRIDEVKQLIKINIRNNVKVGNPAEENTTIGPMISRKQYDRVQSYIKLGIEEGAELLVGGEGHPEGLDNGNFVKATVFTNVKRSMKIARQEIFGPVLSVLTYKDEKEAIAIANDTRYGLMAYVSSGDSDRAMKVARQIDAGRVIINGLKHDPLAPFGGFKESGVGREFGVYGLEEYLEPKTLIQ
ncbi:aldehyde dehydrogenase family protein [Mucilaginibacter sp. CAU 1740]|uniref:aldehyde dehydrogenase family protein n=1 Tax=Mucilaginibacter sp. CAU 1740 TaxID=3140365 RepID=UPI00325A856F